MADDEESSQEHIGASWEIAMIVVFVLVFGGLVGTVYWARRRRQRRRDLEAANNAREPSVRERSSHRGSSTIRGDSSTREKSSMHHKSSVSVTEKSLSYHEKRMSQEPIAKPPRVVTSSRPSSVDFKPPARYYWDQR
ncbi:hypothetical protein GGF50DRAFT_129663 [Schizophyllum commune]